MIIVLADDIVVKSDGNIYFTNPPYGLNPSFGGTGGKAELDVKTLLRQSCIFRNGYASLLSQSSTMEFDAFNFMQSLGGEITLAAMGATENGHILDDEQVCTLTIASGNISDVRGVLSADIA